ncbi:CBS domain-containing protein [Patescibacteria group bacterium]|nr:CBS domain-containing protein [Patescibacteria group bacterium]
MKVADIMQTHVITLKEKDLLKEVGRLIFSLGISGIPVVRGKKFVGIVTQKDILSRLYPTLSELAEDYVHIRNFEDMEKNLSSILNLPISKIMTTNATTINGDCPIMRAQARMLVEGFSHIPVVDKSKNLIGIVSQGDIFRTLIKDEIPKLEQDKYAQFIASHFDDMIDWKKRERSEYPTVVKMLGEKKVENLIELGVWTGEYTIGLSKLGKYNILGLDHNPTMINLCNKKRNRLAEKIKSRIEFMLTDYVDISKKIGKKYDAAISVGNGLAYIPIPIEQIFVELSLVLKERGLIFLQVLNTEKALKRKGRLLSFNAKNQDSRNNKKKEELFVDFLERKDKNTFMQNLIHFDSDGKNWLYKGITSIEVHCLNKEKIKKALEKAGFIDIKFYGGSGKYRGDTYELDLNKPFDPIKSDWLNVVATR